MKTSLIIFHIGTMDYFLYVCQNVYDCTLFLMMAPTLYRHPLKISPMLNRFSYTALKISSMLNRFSYTALKISSMLNRFSYTVFKISSMLNRFSYTALKISSVLNRFSYTAFKISSMLNHFLNTARNISLMFNRFCYRLCTQSSETSSSLTAFITYSVRKALKTSSRLTAV